MADILNYLRQTKNALIGNPTAKIDLHRQLQPGGSLQTIVGYLSLNGRSDVSTSDPSSQDTAIRIRIEAANVITALANGPEEVLRGLLSANAPTAVLHSLADLSPHDPDALKIALLRTLRTLCVTISDYTGPSLWGISREHREIMSEARSMLDYLFQSQPLDIVFLLLDNSSLQAALPIAQLLAFAVRIPKHRLAVTGWIPPQDRAKENKGKRGWEISALVDANSPGRQGGWVIRHLTTLMRSKDFKVQEAALYAIAALVKENPDVAVVLSKSAPESKGQSVLGLAEGFIKDRKPEICLAACLCVTNILRPLTSNAYRPLSITVMHILITIICDRSESASNRMKACYILSTAVADDSERCVDAKRAGVLTKLIDLTKEVTPLTRSQEWEYGEASDTIQLREAALIAISALCLIDEEMRTEAAEKFSFLPLISICLTHPSAGVRYGACQCVRGLARSVRVSRTNLVDSGIGLMVCEIVDKKDEDIRVMDAALAGLCNLVNDFSPLRKVIMEHGMTARIAELSRSPEDKLRVSALWAVKNLLNKATTEEKQIVMRDVGWEYLKQCLADPKEDVQEQAFNILRNIASTETHIDLIFEKLSGDALMEVIADGLASSSEVVQSQATYALSNIANGRTAHKMYILSNLRVLQGLHGCMTHHVTDIRRPAVLCINQLAKSRPYQLRELAIDETLRRMSRESSALSAALGTSAGGPEGTQDIRDSARAALRYLENWDGHPM